MSVGDLIADLQREDPGAARSWLLSEGEACRVRSVWFPGLCIKTAEQKLVKQHASSGFQWSVLSSHTFTSEQSVDALESETKTRMEGE